MKLCQKLSLGLAIANMICLVINLYLGGNEKYGAYPKLFFVTKLLIVPLSYYVYYTFAQKHSVRHIIYGILGFLGDASLISDDKWLFVLGGFAFGFSHLVNLSLFKCNWKKIPKFLHFFQLPGIVLHSALLLPHINLTGPKEIGIFVYSIVLEITAYFALARSGIISPKDKRFWLMWIGYESYIISDFFLLTSELDLITHPVRIPIILSYTIAQLLIFLGHAFSLSDLPMEKQKKKQ